MASATYRTVQDQPNLSRFTIEQVDKAIRKVMETLADKPVPVKKAAVAAKPARARSKR